MPWKMPLKDALKKILSIILHSLLHIFFHIMNVAVVCPRHDPNHSSRQKENKMKVKLYVFVPYLQKAASL